MRSGASARGASMPGSARGQEYLPRRSMRGARHVSYPNPRYSGEDGQVSAKLRPSDQPYDLEIGNGGTQVHYLATGASASGGFGLYRWDFTGPRSRPDPPLHKNVSEAFSMLSRTNHTYPSGGFGLYRWDFTGPRSRPDPHFHKTVSESFYMLSGTIQLYDGRGWADAKPGDFLFVPEGGIHGFRNESGQPASMLLLFAPGAPREAYFESLAEWAVTGKQPSGEERAEFMLRHDTYWL